MHTCRPFAAIYTKSDLRLGHRSAASEQPAVIPFAPFRVQASTQLKASDVTSILGPSSKWRTSGSHPPPCSTFFRTLETASAFVRDA